MLKRVIVLNKETLENLLEKKCYLVLVVLMVLERSVDYVFPSIIGPPPPEILASKSKTTNFEKLKSANALLLIYRVVKVIFIFSFSE